MAKSFEEIMKNVNSATVAIAVSGGIDSMFLTHLTAKWAETRAVKIVCLIVDHKLRQDSSEEARWVQAKLQSWDIQAEILPWEGKKPQSNVHKIAREARYSLLSQYCKSHNINTLLTAHHADDQAETVFMRIARGTGITGLCGIQEYRNDHGLNILRPILSWTKFNILSYMQQHEILWAEDPSNQSMKYERNKIRHFLKQYARPEELLNRLNLLAYNAQRTEDFLNTCMLQALENITFDDSIDLQDFRNLHAEIGLRILRYLLIKVSGNSIPPRLASLERLYHRILNPESFRSTLHGCIVECKHEKIHFRLENLQ